MKKLGSLLFAFLLFSSLAIASGQQITVGVNGMVCGFCAQGIEKKFRAEPSVESVKVNLSEKIVRLTLKEGQQLDESKIRKILTDAGYAVEKIERK